MKSSCQLGGEFRPTGDVSMRLRASFYRQHFSAAKYFAQSAEFIEESVSQPEEEDRSRHRAYVTGCIFSSVAALEASINELYFKANGRDMTALAGLSDSILCELASEWSNVDRKEVLEKYQAALEIAGKAPFNRGSPPYQDVASLVTLRNALVHYRPERHDEKRMHAKLRTRLKDKFPPNGFSQSSLWFPHQCLGAGCARWACRSTEWFMADFCSKMGIPERFSPHA